MIIVDDVYKRYQTDHGMGKWILGGVSLTIPAKTNVGLIGRNGAGKSTLLNLIGGVDQPSKGRVERHCRVSWPLGYSGGFPVTLTGRQAAKFICRIHGEEEEIPEKLRFILEFTELADAFDEPIKTYSPGMRSRLNFALSLAFEFEVYLADEVTSAGDAVFQKKAKAAFVEMMDRAGLIMVSHAEGMLKEFCTAGIWLHEGQVQWFDKIDDALYAYKQSNGEMVSPQSDDTTAAPVLQGHVTLANDSIVGWATNSLTSEIVSVDILHGDLVLMTVAGLGPRPQLKERGINTTGVGGFRMSPTQLGLKTGDTVRIVFAGTQVDLLGSPLQID